MTIRDTATGIVRKSALAYVGALALTGDTALDTFNTLAKRGASTEKAARAQLRTMSRKLRREANVVADQAEEQTAEARNFLTESRDRLLDTLMIPTQHTLSELNHQVERLTSAIDDLRTKVRRQQREVTAEPMPGYDKMNVDTVLSQLPRLEESQLLAVQAYEQGHQVRVTVLRAVERAMIERQQARGVLSEPAMRTSVEPLPGYAQLRAEEAIEKLNGLNETELLHVRTYEAEHQNRVTVLRAVDERLVPTAE